jgi:hypothetical protein
MVVIIKQDTFYRRGESIKKDSLASQKEQAQKYRFHSFGD